MVNLYLIGYKGFECLKFLTAHYREMIAHVIIGKDGGVANDFFNEMVSLCKDQRILFSEKNTFVPTIECNYSLCISWKWIIKEKLDKLIILHDSILPKYRGFNPLVSCLINGEKEIGVTALFASEKYDEGEMIDCKRMNVTYPVKIQEVIEKITKLYIFLLDDIFKKIKNNDKISSKSQNSKEATYSLWRNLEDYKIDWTWSAEKVKRFVDAVGYPYDGAYTLDHNKNKIRVQDCSVMEDVEIENRTAGKIIFLESGCPVVVCGYGLLKILSAVSESAKEQLLPWNHFKTCFS